MKKHWLRGLLLGVSMALLLAGGVAMAAPTLTIEPYCNVCCDNCREPWTCDGWSLSSSGWAPAEMVTGSLTSPGPFGQIGGPMTANAAGKIAALDIYLMCTECYRNNVVPYAYEDIYGDWKPGDYGEWTLKLQGASGTVAGHLYFAQNPGACQAMEFVPEPGSVMLLGSGLVGLAGYATLRWRARE